MPAQTSHRNTASSWTDWDNDDGARAETELGKSDATRLAREQRKLLRQKELKEKREAKQAANKFGHRQS